MARSASILSALPRRSRGDHHSDTRIDGISLTSGAPDLSGPGLSEPGSSKLVALPRDAVVANAFSQSRSLSFSLPLLALSVGVLPLMACSGSTSKSASNANSQVVATVNGTELTLAQLENTRPFNFLTNPYSGAIDGPPLDALINEELLVQEARRAKLDDDAGVQNQIERATRKILSEAYMQREIAPKVAVSNDEIRAFYDRYPALFKHRRIFEFTEFVVADDALSEQLRAEISLVRSADELRNRLKRRTVKFTQSKQVMTAEQLPMDRMNELSTATVGDVLLMRQDAQHTRVLAITSIEEDPQALAQAKPRIEDYLLNARARQLLLDHLKLVRATAAIAVPRSAAATTENASTAPLNKGAAGSAFQLGAISHVGTAPAP